MDKRRLILIDLSGIFWAAWHASADEAVSAAFEKTVGKVTALRGDYELCAVCCDMPPYHRKQIYPEYKAQRDAPEPQAIEQFARVKARLVADGFLLWGAKGFEADDVMATAVEHAKRDGLAVTVASSDKDLVQLVDDEARVRVHSPMSGVMYTRDQVVAKFGVTPDLIADLLALMGDTSDNVPGVPGVGIKTAAKLLLEWGSLSGVFANADKVTPPKIAAAIAAHGDAARLARRLVALSADVPIEWKQLYEERKPMPLADTEAEMDAIEEEPEAPQAPKSEQRPAGDEALPPVAPTQTALIVRAQADWSLALEPSTPKAAWAIAGALENSRLYQNFGTQAAIYAVVMRGRSLGLDATTALASFHNIKGKLTMHADLIEALVLRSGKAEYFDVVETTAKVATYATKRVGSRREVVITFSIEDAFHAGLVEKHPEGRDGLRGISDSGKPSNWDKYRATMLRMRAKTQLCRAVYTDVVLGLYSSDEMDDGKGVIDAQFEAA